jgi:uncharacterized protein (DUF2141 family)
MRRSDFLAPVLVTAIFFVAASCAKVSSPTGGPRDKLPPVVLSSMPINGARNFTGNKITITFNEYVSLDKITEKLMISPPIGKRPQVLIKGKSVIIGYDDKLRDSTTYTFYFGDAIRDLNEGNILDNYQFVFSTGSVIDSLSVTGSVLTSYTLDPAENTLVLLYDDLSDSAVMKNLPAYISKTDKEGSFRLNNLRPGKYNLFALKDIDNSRNFNLPEEEFAFLDAPVLITPETNFIPEKRSASGTLPDTVAVLDTIAIADQYTLYLFKPEKKMRYLTSSSRSIRYQLIYTLSRPPDTLDFNVSLPGASADSYFIERSRERDTLTVWLRDSTLYSNPQLSTVINYPFTDSVGSIIQKTDTILMRFLMPRTPIRGKIKPVPFRVFSVISQGALRPGQEIIFRSETPLRPPDTSRIRLYELKGTERIKLPYSFRIDTTNSRKMKFNADLSQGKNYLFIADSAAFGSIYGEHSDSTGTRISIRNDETFGKVLLNINNFEGNNIIQLLTNQNKVIMERPLGKSGKADFGLLDRGIYRVRNIYDLNGDGKWTTGDYILKRQPEPVSFYDQELEVKENWNFENNWDISNKNTKKIKLPSATQGR